MSKHIKLFENSAAYEAAELEYPTVSLILETGEIKIEEKPDPNFVDLGLPSGTLWAKCNIGANSPEEHGLYFQWGATQGYIGAEALTHSTWTTAPFNNGSSSYDSAYFATVSSDVCPNGVLAAEYDAAYANTNGKQKIPTLDQIRELHVNTTSTWTTINGVNGRKFTSKSDETKSIFIPASGFFSDGNQWGEDAGYVWSSSLETDYPFNAYILIVDNEDAFEDIGTRTDGLSVRGVKSK